MSDVDLADLEAFAAVARARSFRSVARLARRLGLFLERGPAPAGGKAWRAASQPHDPQRHADRGRPRLLERLGPALGEVAAALDAVNGFRDSPTGTLRLNVPTAVARLVLPRDHRARS